jgi:hypothetical protein
MLVVLAIMAALMLISVSAFGPLKHSQVRAEAMRMSGALRMVYGRAAVNGLRYQVSFDIDANSYSVECSPENVLLDPDDDDDDRPFYAEDTEADPFGIGVSPPTLLDCSEPLLNPTALRHDVEILRVLTTHHREPVEDGIATVAYFPNGFVERSLIWIGHEDGMVLTLSVDPMTGRVFIYAKDLDVPEDFFEVEED